MLVEQRQRETGAIAEAAIQRAGADAGATRHILHRDCVDAELADQGFGRFEDARAVARGIGADLGLTFKEREFLH